MGPPIEIIICKTGGASCPTTRFLAYSEMTPVSFKVRGTPVFVHEDGRPLTYRQALAKTQSFAQTLGFVGTDYGTHSYRSGLVTQAAMTGMPSYTIKVLGRWSSNCYEDYMRRDTHGVWRRLPPSHKTSKTADTWAVPVYRVSCLFASRCCLTCSDVWLGQYHRLTDNR